jgi:hypothetical protein
MINSYKNVKINLLKSDAAVWYNEICKVLLLVKLSL